MDKKSQRTKGAQTKSPKKLNEAKFLQGILESFNSYNPSSDSKANPPNFSDDDYRDFLEKMFSEVRFSNPRNFRILNYSLSQIKFDFANFIKFLCVYLQFTDGLLTKLKIICLNSSKLKLSSSIFPLKNEIRLKC